MVPTRRPFASPGLALSLFVPYGYPCAARPSSNVPSHPSYLFVPHWWGASCRCVPVRFASGAPYGTHVLRSGRPGRPGPRLRLGSVPGALRARAASPPDRAVPSRARSALSDRPGLRAVGAARRTGSRAGVRAGPEAWPSRPPVRGPRRSRYGPGAPEALAAAAAWPEASPTGTGRGATRPGGRIGFGGCPPDQHNRGHSWPGGR